MTKGPLRVERGYHPTRKDSPDYHCYEWNRGLVATVSLDETTSGGAISFLVARSSFVDFQRKEIESNWLYFSRLEVVLSISFGISEKQYERDSLRLVERYWEEIRHIANNLETALPIESFRHFPESYRRWIWRLHRKFIRDNFPDLKDLLGVNRLTTLDFLNLQALGCKDYQLLIAEEERAKPLAIRDRIAYARKHGWLESAIHGERMPYMTRLVK